MVIKISRKNSVQGVPFKYSGPTPRHHRKIKTLHRGPICGNANCTPENPTDQCPSSTGRKDPCGSLKVVTFQPWAKAP